MPRGGSILGPDPLFSELQADLESPLGAFCFVCSGIAVMRMMAALEDGG